MATIMRLWLIRETELARKYSTVPPVKSTDDSCVWVPKSIIEHTTKRGDEHEVKLPDWFIEKNGL